MKNKLVLFSMVVLCVFSTFSLAACNFNFLNDDDLAKQNLEKLISYMENKDRAGIKSLFATNKLPGIENLDNSIDELLTYYTGKYVPPKNVSGPMTSRDQHEGRVVKYHKMSNDVTTTENVYRLGIKWYVEDMRDAGNVGIWSFYILKFADDPNQEYSYWGDGYWTEGIHIGKIYIEKESQFYKE